MIRTWEHIIPICQFIYNVLVKKLKIGIFYKNFAILLKIMCVRLCILSWKYKRNLYPMFKHLNKFNFYSEHREYCTQFCHIAILWWYVLSSSKYSEVYAIFMNKMYDLAILTIIHNCFGMFSTSNFVEFFVIELPQGRQFKLHHSLILTNMAKVKAFVERNEQTASESRFYQRTIPYR